MNETLVSIIIPIYKVEKYINKCVDSVINQTYKNLEIILVDDGSPDECPQICDAYAKKDDRITVIHKLNGGLSSARNAGLDVCKGEYICFVDSDDYVSSSYIEKMYEAIVKYKADMVICGVELVDENYNILVNNDYSLKPELISKNEVVDRLFEPKNVPYVVAWNKMYSRKIWDNLRYPLGKIHEDEFVAYDILKNSSNGIYLLDDKLYFYMQRQSSIMGSLQTNEKLLDAVDAMKYRVNRVVDERTYYSLAIKQLMNMYIVVYKRIYKNKEINQRLYNDFLCQYKKYKKLLKGKIKLKMLLFKYIRFIYKLL